VPKQLLIPEVKQPFHSVVTFFLYRHTLQRILLEGSISRLVLHAAPTIASHPSALGSLFGGSDLPAWQMCMIVRKPMIRNRKQITDYHVRLLPRMRRLVVDQAWLALRKHMIHGLIEVDVTTARQVNRRLPRSSRPAEGWRWTE
jgi:hypothetical protein